jgi:tetratricopeptide (TPR) repeat protein
MPGEPAPSSATDEAAQAASIHREVYQVFILVAVAIAAFFLTSAVAASNHAMSLRDAEEWYGRGQDALGAGRIDEAIDDLRRAAVRNRTDKSYVLALAHALTLNHDDEAARSVLLTLRDSAPENTDINLALARLAAHRQDVTEALRFYHNALYAPWPAEMVDVRRRVRLELVRFLLAHAQAGRALAELIAASADVPDNPTARVEIAQLFAQAGDNEHALQQFQVALRLDPDDTAALAGAGKSAFQSGKYALARGYLRRVPDDVGDVADARQIVEFVLTRDPLASRIGTVERRRRLVSNLTYARERMIACVSQARAGETNADAALVQDANDFADQIEGTAPLEQDTIEAGVDLVSRIAGRIAASCPPTNALDRALVLIGREHGGDAR